MLEGFQTHFDERLLVGTNSLSDIYAMGGEPRLALNILYLKDSMDSEIVQEILHGGYSKAYEANTIIIRAHHSRC